MNRRAIRIGARSIAYIRFVSGDASGFRNSCLQLGHLPAGDGLHAFTKFCTRLAPARTCATVSCARESSTVVVLASPVNEVPVCSAGRLLSDYARSADHKVDARRRVGQDLPADTGCRSCIRTLEEFQH